MPSQSQGKRRLTSQDGSTKRFRVSRACDQCRTAREKCDGNQPICLPCVESKRACTYTSVQRKRGLQPGYIRSLETTLAFIFQNSPETETLVNTQLAQDNTVLLARGTKESNRLHKSWTKSKFCRGVTKALAGEQIISGDDKVPTSDDDSEVDVEDATLLREFKSRPQEEAPWTYETDVGAVLPTIPTVSDAHRIAIQHSETSSPLISLPADCWKLLETYATYTQCWLPMCEQLDALKLSYSYPEQGLALSHDMPDSGDHAEMWSILAVGCVQESSVGIRNPEDHSAVTPGTLYSIARLLIPNEVGRFDLGHVKALLNLAVFNISRSMLRPAWLLVGAASRILLTLEEDIESANPRRKNVFASCFLLDSLLALHLQQRPYLDRGDLAWTGKISEEGMEEWKPWSGDAEGTTRQVRQPTLALSSFNGLLEIVDILVSAARPTTARNFLHEMIGRLEMWKSSLPSKLDYIRSDSSPPPMTPPALLLKLTYLATAFALVPSQAWLQRVLELLDTIKTQFRFAKLPPIVTCLLHSIRRCSSALSLDQGAQHRMQKLFADFDQVHSISSSQIHSNSIPFSGTSPAVAQMRSLEMNHLSPQSFTSRVGESASEHTQPLTNATLLEDLLPGMHPRYQRTNLQSLDSQPFGIEGTASMLDAASLDPQDPYNAFVSGDLDSFFDDLASLHGANKLQNNPQFMQNLGYSSEISMADLLTTDPGRFMPLPTSSNVGPEHPGESPQFPLNAFYDAG